MIAADVGWVSAPAPFKLLRPAGPRVAQHGNRRCQTMVAHAALGYAGFGRLRAPIQCDGSLTLRAGRCRV